MFFRRLIHLLPSLFLIGQLKAETEKKESKIKVNLAMMAKSASLFHGVNYYNSPSAIVGPGLIFYDFVSVNGPSFHLTHKFEKSSLRYGANYFDDSRPLFTLKKYGPDYRQSRKSIILTWMEFNAKLDQFNFKVMCEKELKEWTGQSLNFSLGRTLVPLTSLTLNLSFLSSDFAKYTYGKSGVGGLAHTDLSIGIFLPFLFKNGILNSKLTYSSIVKSANINSELTRGEMSNLSFDVLAVWPLLD